MINLQFCRSVLIIVLADQYLNVLIVLYIISHYYKTSRERLKYVFLITSSVHTRSFTPRNTIPGTEVCAFLK